MSPGLHDRPRRRVFQASFRRGPTLPTPARYPGAVRFLLARFHTAEYRRQIEAAGFPAGHQPEEPMQLRCPRCDALYLAELADDEDPWDFEARAWAALVRLDRECPDHAHAFTVA